ncbi:MAG: sigma 54-interacting transcriptional regulator [Myxococcales bacterium]|nr:sigma 54-interacting transcriptional regulator [Myxococcales bacterium]
MSAAGAKSREQLELDLLHEVSRILSESRSLREAVATVLRVVVERTELRRATITLLDEGRGELFIDESYGLSSTEQSRGRYKIGEGVTGQVVASGKSVIVPRVSESPEFLNRTGARRRGGEPETSFVCVPLEMGRRVIGAFSVDRVYAPDNDLDADARLLEILGALVSQGVAMRLEAAEATRRLEEENERLARSLQSRLTPDNIVGRSKAIREVYDLIAQVARANTSVLITGESGTGKELVAGAIHAGSDRARGAFVRVNCGALPESVIESELFGHERGAFTGATQQRKGRFELADGGTLFLDEVGELTPATQVKLLRVLQERELERVGGTKTVKVDVRVIAATSRDLRALVEDDRFRLDLFYRLNVFPIHVPPLRERGSDVLLLADHFVATYNRKHGKDVRRVATSAIDMLTAYHWPGNVRELENCIERAVLLSSDDVLHGHLLPPTLQTDVASGTRFAGTLQERVDDLERTLVIDALKSTRGNMAGAARMLGLTERIMGLRVQKHEIDVARFRRG